MKQTSSILYKEHHPWGARIVALTFGFTLVFLVVMLITLGVTGELSNLLELKTGKHKDIAVIMLTLLIIVVITYVIKSKLDDGKSDEEVEALINSNISEFHSEGFDKVLMVQAAKLPKATMLIDKNKNVMVRQIYENWKHEFRMDVSTFPFSDIESVDISTEPEDFSFNQSNGELFIAGSLFYGAGGLVAAVLLSELFGSLKTTKLKFIINLHVKLKGNPDAIIYKALYLHDFYYSDREEDISNFLKKVGSNSQQVLTSLKSSFSEFL